jgi:UDP-2,4-diacetamido-2,4,6-trideoxy-beta-L-altropyranose hydrolase
MDDAQFLFDTRNDPEARANSVDQRPLVYESHVAWLSSKLEDPDTLIYIAEENRESVGYVRFHLQDTVAVVSIGLAAEFRGRGLGRTILEQGIAQLTGIIEVHAVVKKTNATSIRLFESSGFKEGFVAFSPYANFLRRL